MTSVADTSAPAPESQRVRSAIVRAAETLVGSGIPVPPIEGKLLRPAVAAALVPSSCLDDSDTAFWLGALAIQMVHEASLLHDDILDDAATRRGNPSLVAAKGVDTALVLGDHYLTGAYRVAAQAEAPSYLLSFIEATERTVAGEIEQARCSGSLISPESYESIIRGKSGALFGAAAALAATRIGEGLTVDRGSFVDFGVRVGALYQRLDDFLDYCVHADLGKPPLQDWRQQKTTFVLHLAGIDAFDLREPELLARLFDGDEPVMFRALERLENEARALIAEQRRLVPESDDRLGRLLAGWMRIATAAYRAEARSGASAAWVRSAGAPTPASVEAEVVATSAGLGGPSEWPAYFGENSKTFRFASRLFPASARAKIEGVYAFCRYTDDLVDEADVPPEIARQRLEVWRGLSRRAYEGADVGVPLLASVMGEMARAEVPFSYADELLTGVGMDLEPVHYERMQDLEVYTYRVASVVGGWITELFGLRDEALLQRAFALGHAMQLTNILRDVGEDWRNDRLYLPRGLLREFNLGPEAVDAVARQGQVSDRWIDMTESLMAVADRHYDLAFEAIPELPAFYARPVAVAARVYQGIQEEIRRNGYDNGTLRAHTSFTRKLLLGFGALRELRGRRPVPGGLTSLAPQDA